MAPACLVAKHRHDMHQRLTLLLHSGNIKWAPGDASDTIGHIRAAVVLVC